jgi:hypothetical protein
MKEHEEELLPKYTSGETRAKYSDAECYKLHDSKFSDALSGVSRREEVRVARRQPTLRSDSPQLGEAIMSTIALGVARREGLDIVTASDEIHCVASVSDEREVFENLLRGEPLQKAPARENLTDDLAEIVMTTLFDFERLTAEQVAELQKDGKDLRKFKNKLASQAAEIPDIADPEERRRRLQQAADEVIEGWHEYKRSLPRFALDARR